MITFGDLYVKLVKDYKLSGVLRTNLSNILRSHYDLDFISRDEMIEALCALLSIKDGVTKQKFIANLPTSVKIDEAFNGTKAKIKFDFVKGEDDFPNGEDTVSGEGFTISNIRYKKGGTTNQFEHYLADYHSAGEDTEEEVIKKCTAELEKVHPVDFVEVLRIEDTDESLRMIIEGSTDRLNEIANVFSYLEDEGHIEIKGGVATMTDKTDLESINDDLKNEMGFDSDYFKSEEEFKSECEKMAKLLKMVNEGKEKTDDEKYEELAQFLEDEGIIGYTGRIHNIMTGQHDKFKPKDLDKFLEDPDGDGFGIFGYTRAIRSIYEDKKKFGKKPEDKDVPKEFDEDWVLAKMKTFGWVDIGHRIPDFMESDYYSGTQDNKKFVEEFHQYIYDEQFGYLQIGNDLDEKKSIVDVDKKKGTMHNILGLKPSAKISDHFKNGKELAQALYDKISRKQAQSLLNYAANINHNADPIFRKASTVLKGMYENKNTNMKEAVDRHGKKLVAAKFYIDEKSYDGWHDPKQKWNGFATPMFDKETTLQILKDCECPYKEDDEKIEAVLDTGNDSSTSEYDDLRAGEIAVDGEKIMVYSPGSHSWSWIEDTNESVKFKKYTNLQVFERAIRHSGLGHIDEVAETPAITSYRINGLIIGEWDDSTNTGKIYEKKYNKIVDFVSEIGQKVKKKLDQISDDDSAAWAAATVITRLEGFVEKLKGDNWREWFNNTPSSKLKAFEDKEGR